MAPSTLPNRFRKFRLIVLALASIISLAWSIIIAVYMANNWSSYNSGQRGLLFGLIIVDFVGSILLYLMIVVQYRFWPDAVRTAVLLGLHVAGAVVFMMLSPNFPCPAFGSTENCHIMTITVITGSWVISALMLMYAICLPVVAFIPRTPTPTQADDLENRPDIAEVKDDMRKSHASSASHAGLLKNQEGMSPDVSASELPGPLEKPAARNVRSNTSSFSSLQISQQAMGDGRIKLETPITTSVYSDASPRFSVAKTILASDNADRSLNSSGSSSPAQYPRRSHSIQSPPLPDRFIGESLDANRDSVASSFYGSTYEFPMVSEPLAEAPHRTPSMITGSSASVYSQSTIPARAKSTSPNRLAYASAANASQTQQSSLLTSSSMRHSPGHLSVHSMMTTVHDHGEHQFAGADYNTSSNGFLSPPLTALPTPRFSAGSSQPTFELHLSDVPKRDSKEKLTDVPRDVVRDPVQPSLLARPSLQHVRTDSTNSIVDVDEWRRLVLSAAGR
ncbi:uncharacterized protein EDB91DRAFT_1093191 [Suillus paluster]|uniref:uncharacterized protein n=1 Tax=Suillus paluster TaxID=48578 RepID=UPI001B86FC31|nr:uncharacterized protein EDB91DRAFT_1093191 [Suillus paluster]KAG1756533.1 hypothetical protein EDB91DRAFT_1093191 [Suillus paluster]